MHQHKYSGLDSVQTSEFTGLSSWWAGWMMDVFLPPMTFLLFQSHPVCGDRKELHSLMEEGVFLAIVCEHLVLEVVEEEVKNRQVFVVLWVQHFLEGVEEKDKLFGLLTWRSGASMQKKIWTLQGGGKSILRMAYHCELLLPFMITCSRLMT